MAHGSREPVEFPDNNRIESSAIGVGRESIKFRAAFFGPETPMSTYSPTTLHPRRSQYSLNSSAGIVRSCPLFAVLTMALIVASFSLFRYAKSGYALSSSQDAHVRRDGTDQT
jgi:hypothetical protein